VKRDEPLAKHVGRYGWSGVCFKKKTGLLLPVTVFPVKQKSLFEGRLLFWQVKKRGELGNCPNGKSIKQQNINRGFEIVKKKSFWPHSSLFCLSFFLQKTKNRKTKQKCPWEKSQKPEKSF